VSGERLWKLTSGEGYLVLVSIKVSRTLAQLAFPYGRQFRLSDGRWTLCGRLPVARQCQAPDPSSQPKSFSRSDVASAPALNTSIL